MTHTCCLFSWILLLFCDAVLYPSHLTRGHGGCWYTLGLKMLKIIELYPEVDPPVPDAI